ncbi:hypothetical protein MACH09_37060 [Vibrio sp. MACH09]|uniref:SH3 domain-containing protein n=1 Tax=unclassified Vibrio TaxID=2614977 RepID=UPI0014939F79|nr:MULTISPECIES: SH3 domain-containing protein [unclassified Vibrio]NOI64596.1 SH3 domain-containing protein [Vibrio sp. 99-8-1]GLO63198.1 hypothetical protein MACH09_37060 [Vibrio sp. MACH09]
MKKIVIIIVILLVLAAAGGGAYYYFFMMNQEEEMVEEVMEEEAEPMESAAVPAPVIEPNVDYYVISDRLNVRSYPRRGSAVRGMLRKGDQLTALEVKGDWVRFSDYEVHKSGNDVADWVNRDYLSHDKPMITPIERRKTMMALIKRSDDLKEYEESFIQGAEKLIKSGQCTFEDFELVGGWVRSVTFNLEPVYFIYCGGTDREDKVYLNVESGETFTP